LGVFGAEGDESLDARGASRLISLTEVSEMSVRLDAAEMTSSMTAAVAAPAIEYDKVSSAG